MLSWYGMLRWISKFKRKRDDDATVQEAVNASQRDIVKRYAAEQRREIDRRLKAIEMVLSAQSRSD